MAAVETLTTTVSTKGQVILPKGIRQRRNWAAGTRLLVEDTPDGVLLKVAPVFAPTLPEDVAGMLAHPGPPKTVEEMDATNNPEDESAGTRKVPFSRELYIEQDDFREVPPPKYFRLTPGREVRLRYGYFITAKSVVKNDKGEVVQVHCTYDPATRGGNAPDGRKVKSTIHWVSAQHAVDAEVRVYENLFTKENLGDLEEGKDPLDYLNPNSLEVIPHAKLEPLLANAAPSSRFQFERLGYFCVDRDSKPGAPVFNRTVALKDTWAKVERKQEQKKA